MELRQQEVIQERETSQRTFKKLNQEMTAMRDEIQLLREEVARKNSNSEAMILIADLKRELEIFKNSCKMELENGRGLIKLEVDRIKEELKRDIDRLDFRMEHLKGPSNSTVGEPDGQRIHRLEIDLKDLIRREVDRVKTDVDLIRREEDSLKKDVQSSKKSIKHIKEECDHRIKDFGISIMHTIQQQKAVPSVTPYPDYP